MGWRRSLTWVALFFFNKKSWKVEGWNVGKEKIKVESWKVGKGKSKNQKRN